MAEWWYAVPTAGAGKASPNIYVQGTQYGVGNAFTYKGISYTVIDGPSASKADESAKVAGFTNTANPAIPGTAIPLSPAKGLGGSLGGAAEAAVPGVTSTLDFLTRLTDASLWIRVAKVTVGGVILVVGLIKLTGADQKIGGVAEKAVKAAPFL